MDDHSTGERWRQKWARDIRDFWERLGLDTADWSDDELKKFDDRIYLLWYKAGDFTEDGWHKAVELYVKLARVEVAVR